MSERSLMTKRYAVPAFSFVTFLLCMVSAIVKPGPTVPFTVLAVAADPLLVAASAAAPIAANSKERVRVIFSMSTAFLEVLSSSIGQLDRRGPGRGFAPW